MLKRLCSYPLRTKAFLSVFQNGKMREDRGAEEFYRLDDPFVIALLRSDRRNEDRYDAWHEKDESVGVGERRGRENPEAFGQNFRRDPGKDRMPPYGVHYRRIQRAFEFVCPFFPLSAFEGVTFGQHPFPNAVPFRVVRCRNGKDPFGKERVDFLGYGISTGNLSDSRNEHVRLGERAGNPKSHAASRTLRKFGETPTGERRRADRRAGRSSAPFGRTGGIGRSRGEWKGAHPFLRGGIGLVSQYGFVKLVSEPI